MRLVPPHEGCRLPLINGLLPLPVGALNRDDLLPLLCAHSITEQSAPFLRPHREVDPAVIGDVAAYASNLKTGQPPEPIAVSVALEAVETGLLARNRTSLGLQTARWGTANSLILWSERRDLNPGPPVPQTGALTGLRYAPLPYPRTSTLMRPGMQGPASCERRLGAAEHRELARLAPAPFARALWSDEKPRNRRPILLIRQEFVPVAGPQGAQIRSCSLDEAERRGRIARGLAERPSGSKALAQRADWKGPSRIARLPSDPTLGREAGNSAANDYCR
jgi:hypothetical protein